MMPIRNRFSQHLEVRKFAAVWCALLLLAALFWSRASQSPELRGTLVGIALVFAALGLAWPRALVLPYRLWLGLGHILGKINATLILSVVYFTLLTGAALAMRILGRDPLARAIERKRSSYLEMIQSSGRNKTRYERQF